MLQRRIPGPRSLTPLRPIRVVIEDAQLATSAVRGGRFGSADIRICSGPSSDSEVCPLVVDGGCPLGPCDVVVSALGGPWADSVRAAWQDAGVTVASPSSAGPFSTDARLQSRLGAAYQAMFLAQFRSPDDQEVTD